MTNRLLVCVASATLAAGSAVAAEISSLIFYEYTHNATQGVD